MKPKHSLKTYLDQWRVLEMTLMQDSEFCRQLKIDRKTSFNWRKKKLLPFIRIGGKVYYQMIHLLPFLSKRSLE